MDLQIMVRRVGASTGEQHRTTWNKYGAAEIKLQFGHSECRVSFSQRILTDLVLSRLYT